MKEDEIKKNAEEYESKFNYSVEIARHFEEGAKWALSQPQIIEIFGKRVKIVEDNDSSAKVCMKCAFSYECTCGHLGICRNADEKFNRHFVEVDEDDNEIKQ